MLTLHGAPVFSFSILFIIFNIIYHFQYYLIIFNIIYHFQYYFIFFNIILLFSILFYCFQFYEVLFSAARQTHSSRTLVTHMGWLRLVGSFKS